MSCSNTDELVKPGELDKIPPGKWTAIRIMEENRV